MRTFGMGLMVHLGQVKRPTRIYHTQVCTESFSSNFVFLGYPQKDRESVRSGAPRNNDRKTEIRRTLSEPK